MMRVRHRRRSDSGAVAGERFDARIPGLRAVTANFFLRYAAANLAKNTFFFCTHADGLYRRGGIAQAAGIEVDGDPRVLVAEVPAEHNLVWTEQMMPVLPFTRVRNVDEAIEAALPPGIYVTGSPYRGVGMPDCVHQSQQTAEKISAEFMNRVGV